jgi:phage shock protein E
MIHGSFGAFAEDNLEITKVSNPILVDVRTDVEWNAGHLISAIHIPMQILLDEISSAASNKHQKIYLYCKSGARAARAKTMLENMGYTNVLNIGGIKDGSAKLNKTIIQDYNYHY